MYDTNIADMDTVLYADATLNVVVHCTNEKILYLKYVCPDLTAVKQNRVRYGHYQSVSALYRTIGIGYKPT